LTTLIKTGDGTPIETFSSFGALSFSHGTVAFEGIYAGGRGIFTASESEFGAVIKTGDSLFGSTVMELGFGRWGLDPDGSGSIAFNYRLADGRQGVALAAVVPEPTSIGLWIAALSTSVVRHRRVVSI
jgi:hypothetical protein